MGEVSICIFRVVVTKGEAISLAQSLMHLVDLEMQEHTLSMVILLRVQGTQFEIEREEGCKLVIGNLDLRSVISQPKVRKVFSTVTQGVDWREMLPILSKQRHCDELRVIN